MSRKGPVAVKGMLDFVEDLSKDVLLNQLFVYKAVAFTYFFRT